MVEENFDSESVLTNKKNSYFIKLARNTIGQKIDIAYNHTDTVFKDLDNREITYQFNYYGNTVSIKDTMEHGGFYAYQKDGTGDSNYRYRLTFESKPQRTIINLLKNHSMV